MTDYRPDKLERVEPLYMQQYGLHSAPFSPIHEDRFLFLDVARQEKLNLLAHMVQYSNLLLIVMGENGIGKTSLLQRFVSMAQTDWRICQITANTMMDAEQLMFAAAQGFGLQQLPQDATQLQEMLYARLAALHRQEQTPILIIDEAQTLPKEALLAIFHLADSQVEEGGLIRIILSCEPQIDKILQSKEVRPLRERVTHTMELAAFEEDGIAEYLKHRMAVAGFSGITPFSPKIVKKIFKESQGLPAKINEQAHLFLERGEAAMPDVAAVLPPPTSPRSNPRTLVWITLGALVVIGVLVYQDQINQLFAPPANAPVTSGNHPEEIAAAPTPTPQQKIIPLVPNTPVTSQPDATVLSQSSVTVTPTSKPNLVVSTPEPLPPITVDIRSLEPAALTLSNKTQLLIISGQGFTPDSQVNMAWSGHQKTLASDQVKIINTNEIHVNITTGNKPDMWSVQVIDPKFGKSKRVEFAVGEQKQPATLTTAPTIDNNILNESWVRTQSPLHYTVQLFSSNTLPGAKNFISQHKLDKNTALIHSVSKGKHWYSVLHGSFVSETAANKAITQLPAGVRKTKPWVRRFDGIQTSLVATASAKTSTTSTPQPTSKIKPTAAAKAVAQVNSTSLTQHEAQLWSQDPRHFTLQLLVSQQEKNADRFIKKYPLLHTKAAYFHSQHNTRELYTVVWGDFVTHDQAEAAIKQLPVELRQVKPRVRTYASIHAEMKKP